MTPLSLQIGDASYPRRLIERQANNAPNRLTVLGEMDVLHSSKTGLFCSANAPGHVILSAHDEASRWRDAGRCVISGFHSPLEKDCLQILLRGRQPIIICLARGIQGMRIPVAWKKPLEDGRLLIISQFAESERRVTQALAETRNRLVAALADDIVFAHITRVGHLQRLREEIAAWPLSHRVLGE